MFIDCVKFNPKCTIYSKGISIVVAYHSFHHKTYTIYNKREPKSVRVILTYVLCKQCLFQIECHIYPNTIVSTQVCIFH